MLRKIALFFLFVLNVLHFFGQTQNRVSIGAKVSLLVHLGSHRNDFGVKFDTYANYQFLQLNANTSFRYFGTNLGDRCTFGEIRSQLGAVAYWGKNKQAVNMDWDGALHQTQSPYSLGYGYLWYWDKMATSQRSGTWNIGIKRIDIQFENDVFGGQARDRFRTGALAISYRDSMRKATVAMVLWTGETRNTNWNKTPQERMPSGFRDLTKKPYGNLNHGIFYAEIKQTFSGSQTAGFRSGIDAEQVRHIFQNRISHDLIFLPKRMERNTPHYPRLNAQGENVFTRKAARPSQFYFATFLNEGYLY